MLPVIGNELHGVSSSSNSLSSQTEFITLVATLPCNRLSPPAAAQEKPAVQQEPNASISAQVVVLASSSKSGTSKFVEHVEVECPPRLSGMRTRRMCNGPF